MLQPNNNSNFSTLQKSHGFHCKRTFMYYKFLPALPKLLYHHLYPYLITWMYRIDLSQYFWKNAMPSGLCDFRNKITGLWLKESNQMHFCSHKHPIYLKDCDYKSKSLLLETGTKASKDRVVNSSEIVFSASFQKLRATNVWPFTNGTVSCRSWCYTECWWWCGLDTAIRSSKYAHHWCILLHQEHFSFSGICWFPPRKGTVILFFSSNIFPLVSLDQAGQGKLCNCRKWLLIV